MSPVVQALLSLHAFVLFVCTQPVDGLQLSSVQGLLSSQEMGSLEHTPPMQVPVETWHMSVTVHASLVFWQLPVALHALHVPQALLVQQKPSVQLPLMHWLGPVQVRPLALRAQLLLAPAP